MQKQFILFVLLSIIIAVFAITNADIMTVRLFFWTYDLSGSLVILISVALGGLLVFLFGLVNFFKNKKVIWDLHKEVKSAQITIDELTRQKNLHLQQIEDLMAELSSTRDETIRAMQAKNQAQ
jgi:lipopolysaccharide assembly protein A